MRIRATLFVALLGTALSGVAFGQQAATTTQPKAPSGLSFAYDAPHGQLTANGLAVKLNPDTADTAPITGTVKITINLTVKTTVPTGAKVPCSAIVIGGAIDTTALSLEGGIETVSGYATAGPKAGSMICSLSIPYEWTVVTVSSLASTEATSTTVDAMVIAFAAAIVDSNGVTQRETIQIGGVQALPTNGKTTTASYAATL
jgi:hypothetical protein